MKTVRAKLALGLGVIVLVTLVLALLNWLQSRNVQNATEHMYRGGVEATRTLGAAESALQVVRARTLTHVALDDPARLEVIEEQLLVADATFLGYLEEAEGLVDEETRDLLVKARAGFATFVRFRDEEIIPVSRAGENARGLALVLNDTSGAFADTVGTLRNALDRQGQASEAVRKEVEDDVAEAARVAVIGAILVAILAAIVSGLLSRSISTRLSTLATMARSLREGNLDHRAPVEGADEISELARSLNETADVLAKLLKEQAHERDELARAMRAHAALVERIASGDLTGADPDVADGEFGSFARHVVTMRTALRAMSSRIHEVVGALSSASAEIQTTAKEYAASATESAAAVAQTVASVDEVAQTAEQVATTARGVEDASRRSIDVSTAGHGAVRRSIEAMEGVRDRVQSIAERVLALSEDAQEVGQIITTVNELAEQSNMLSLNASIEAARAGEHGHGFAVVAREIRSLAEQSRQATSTVRDMLSNIQRSTGKAVMAAEEGTKVVAQALETVGEAGRRIDQLAEVLRSAAASADQIRAGAQQQVLGMSQISQAVRSIDEAARHSVDGTRHVERAARDLNGVSARLQQAVAQYQT